MARVATLDKNPNVKTIVSVTGDKYKKYTVILNDVFYENVSYGDGIHPHESTEKQIDIINEKIARLENCKSSDYQRNSIEFYASTLTEAHEVINFLPSLEKWNQNRLDMIDYLKKLLNNSKEKLKDEDRKNRGRSTYTFKEEQWKSKIVKAQENQFPGCFISSVDIKSAIGNTVKEVADSNVNVVNWKEMELKRLFEVLEKVNKNIEILQEINVQEAQQWIDDLKKEAIDYIENGNS